MSGFFPEASVLSKRPDAAGVPIACFSAAFLESCSVCRRASSSLRFSAAVFGPLPCSLSVAWSPGSCWTARSFRGFCSPAAARSLSLAVIICCDLSETECRQRAALAVINTVPNRLLPCKARLRRTGCLKQSWIERFMTTLGLCQGTRPR